MPKVMIVEDDLMIADMIEEILCASGYDVCGIACTVEEGLALAALHMPDLAIIDVRLADGGLGTEIAAKLDRSWTGVLFATGNVEQIIDSTDGEACISKPYHRKDLLLSLDVVRAIHTARMAPENLPSRLFPEGFHLLRRPDVEPRRELAHA
jgi:DNA-binding response OmpR family regulator